MRITWYSNAPWAGTGYGTQTAQAVSRLKHEHKVAILANYGLNGAPFTIDGVSILPTGTDTYSNDVLGQAHRLWLASGPEPEPGWIITLFDVHVLDPKPLEDLHVASWTPVDQRPVPPKVADWARTHRTIAMSRFGQQMFADQGIASDYVPHAIEPVFRPTPSTVRERLQIPEDREAILVLGRQHRHATGGHVVQLPAQSGWQQAERVAQGCRDGRRLKYSVLMAYRKD